MPVRAAHRSGECEWCTELRDVHPYIKDDKKALFTQNVLAKVVELRIPYSAAWVWQFYERSPYLTYDNRNTYFDLEPGYTDLVISKIKEANKELGNRLSSLRSPDTTPPQVVVTWPLERQLACDQLVHAGASDDSGTISEVRFLADGDLETVIPTPPYQFELDAARLGFGKHRITAEAYDSSGNVRRFAVGARSPLCIRERLSHLLGSATNQFHAQSKQRTSSEQRNLPVTTLELL